MTSIKIWWAKSQLIKIWWAKSQLSNNTQLKQCNALHSRHREKKKNEKKSNNSNDKVTVNQIHKMLKWKGLIKILVGHSNGFRYLLHVVGIPDMVSIFGH